MKDIEIVVIHMHSIHCQYNIIIVSSHAWLLLTALPYLLAQPSAIRNEMILIRSLPPPPTPSTTTHHQHTDAILNTMGDGRSEKCVKSNIAITENQQQVEQYTHQPTHGLKLLRRPTSRYRYKTCISGAYVLLLLTLFAKREHEADALLFPFKSSQVKRVAARHIHCLTYSNSYSSSSSHPSIVRCGATSSSVAPQDEDGPDHNLNNGSTNSSSSSSNSADTSTTPARTAYNWTGPTLKIAVPAIFSVMADPLLSLMDTAFIARVGNIELAALGACTSIFHLAFHAFRATTTATTSLVATALQQNNTEEVKEVTVISLKLGFAMGLVVLTCLQLGGSWMLGTMGIPKSSALYPAAWSYLSTRCWAAPAVLGIVVAEGIFRGYGDTKIPLLASAMASIINLVLDPLLMFQYRLGVKGAAAATAISQIGAALVYLVFLRRRRMLPQKIERSTNTNYATAVSATTPINTNTPKQQPQALIHDASIITRVDSGKVIRTIMAANAAMIAKQGSLLLAWAYATARATRLGSAHVAAHQICLSFWLVFALILDGTAVSAQVLMSRAFAKNDRSKVRSLTKYMVRVGILQGLGSTALILVFRNILPRMLTSDSAIQQHLVHLMPHLAWQQLLVSLTLIIESLAAGGNQFSLLGIGTSVATIFSMQALQKATSVEAIWSRGIVTLFVGRLLTASIGLVRVNAWDRVLLFRQKK